MTVLDLLQKHIAKIGYSAIESDYIFSDVFSASRIDRVASLAAFTSTPPSYRNAALAVVEAKGRTATELTANYRALGAPLLFVVSGETVGVWKVTADGLPRQITQAAPDQLHALFSENATLWGPESVQRAKSIGQFTGPLQLDFVDVGLLPAIEGEVHSKLDVLLNETLAEAVGLKAGRARYHIDQRLLFRTIFRLLAAKVLQDRGHQLATTWNPSDINSVLGAISKYYTLEVLPGEQTALQSAVFSSSWERLRNGINFRNISADDLAFVYENTLITRETRKSFGTHGTPRTVAEYVVQRMRLAEFDLNMLRVYEPFAGAGIFMVAALRSLRDELPVGWSDAQRHKFLVQRIAGDEADPFAREVATLSLILADYPNANGWAVSEVDLFKNYRLRERMQTATIILCNPPFEDFTKAERAKYPNAAARSVSKPVVALETALDCSPAAVGFVLPEPFIKGSQYRMQRENIEKKYRDIELVALPDRTFKHSVIRSSLLIARELREPQNRSATSLTSTVVEVRDREQFLRCGKLSATRTSTRAFGQPNGKLWINELQELWDYLSRYRTIGDIASAHRGIEWQGEQSTAISRSPKRGFVAGAGAANAVHTFAISNPAYLDVRPQNLRGGAIHLLWSENKLLANAARLSRGPWCFAATVDREGLVASQQLYGIWPKDGTNLETLCALLNSPLANAYAAVHSPPDRIRRGTVLSIPIPRNVPDRVVELVKRYARVVGQGTDLFSERRTERADTLLNEIDAIILKAYDLPPRLEKELLEFFRDAQRTTLHEWSHWFPKNFQSYIPLHEFYSEGYRKSKNNWPLKVFAPLPESEADALSQVLE
jgi:hypothetical protein